MGLAEILFLLLVTAKLFGFISWSWWIVLIPIYPALIAYLFFMVVFIFGANKTFKKFKKWRD